MLPFVLDASAIVKLALDEPGADAFRAWYKEHAGDELQGPALLYSEVGRVLQKARARPKAKESADLHLEILAPVRLFEPARPDTHDAWKVADGLPFYDAEYVRLAQRNGAVVVTADKKMAERARKLGVQVKEF